MSDQTESGPTGDATQRIDAARGSYMKLRGEIAKLIVGQDDVVEQMLTCVFCGGHGLVVGVPGLAKTMLISTIAQALDLEFSRIQFTPDLMPSDITGTEVIEEDKTTGHRQLRFVPGPIFGNVILADEINRTPPKTQAALLEAMQEGHVTAGGQTHALPSPFFVLATQNPLEQEGTYPLPEAQLDRFMFQILIGYPTADEEMEIVRRSATKSEVTIDPILHGGDIAEIRSLIRSMPVADHVLEYALRLVRSTRVSEGGDLPEIVRSYVGWGAGPRASENLILAAKARAVLADGSTHVTLDHVKWAAKPVLRHRVLTNFNAEADGVTSENIVEGLINATPVSPGDAATREQIDRALPTG